jgi:hypothetical protein
MVASAPGESCVGDSCGSDGLGASGIQKEVELEAGMGDPCPSWNVD